MTNPIKIILIDDHPLILSGLSAMFGNSENMEIMGTYDNTKDAFEYVKNNIEKIDLIISDINMPNETGIEFCKRIKALNCDLKVLILSVYNEASIVREAVLAEADGYVLKNANQHQFMEAIDIICKDGTYFSEEIKPYISQSSLLMASNIQEKINSLSQREVEILKLIAEDNTSEEIAEKLFISIKTVGHHRQHILAKTGCRSSIGLVRFAIDAKLV